MMVKGLRGADNLGSVLLALTCQRGTNSARLPSPSHSWLQDC